MNLYDTMTCSISYHP